MQIRIFTSPATTNYKYRLEQIKMIENTLGLGGVRTTNKKTNLRTYEPPLGYDSSFFGLPDTRDGQNKKRSAQNKKAELEKRSL